MGGVQSLRVRAGVDHLAGGRQKRGRWSEEVSLQSTVAGTFWTCSWRGDDNLGGSGIRCTRKGTAMGRSH